MARGIRAWTELSRVVARMATGKVRRKTSLSFTGSSCSVSSPVSRGGDVAASDNGADGADQASGAVSAELPGRQPCLLGIDRSRDCGGVVFKFHPCSILMNGLNFEQNNSAKGRYAANCRRPAKLRSPETNPSSRPRRAVRRSAASPGTGPGSRRCRDRRNVGSALGGNRDAHRPRQCRRRTSG